MSTFECQNVWSSISIDNTLVSCLANVTHLATIFDTDEERARVGATLIPLAIVVLVVLIFPIFLALRYCVDFCGSNKRRPGYFCYGGEEWDKVSEQRKNQEYNPSDAGCLRSTAYVSLFLAFIPMALLLVGTGDIQTGYNSIFAEIFKLVGWAEEKQNELKKLVTFDNGTTFIEPTNSSIITLVETAISGYDSDIRTADDANKQYVDIIKTVSIVFAVLPVISLLFNALFATFDIRKCLPLLNSFFHFFLLIFYAIIATAVLLLGVLTDRICGERDAALNDQPGIGTWWVVPRCEQTEAFEPVERYFNYTTEVSAQLACEKLAQHCESSSTTYNAGSPEKIFYCPQLTSASTQCLNDTEAKNIIFDASVVALTGAGGPTCTSSPCGVENCRTGCSDATQKSYAANIKTKYDGAVSIQSAENVFTTEIANCTALLQTAMGFFNSCQEIQASVFYVGVGSCIFVGLFILGLVVIFRGQKRFFKPVHKKLVKKRSSSRSPQRSPNRSPRSRSPTSVGPAEKKYRK